MSASYPTLTLPIGCEWGYNKQPKYTTIEQTPISGRRQVRASLQQSPVWEWELSWSVLNENGHNTLNDFQYLQDFYLAMQGSFGAFVFDPSTYFLERLSVTHNLTQMSNGYSGVGDGTTTVFPLWRSSAVLGGGQVNMLEMIQNVSLLNGVYVNGSLVTNYTLSNFPAELTFTSPPALNATIAWDGNFNYLAHFADDVADFEEFFFQLWTMKRLKLEAVLL